MARTRSACAAAAVCLMLLLAATATPTAGAHLERGRELVEKSGGSAIPVVNDGPNGKIDYHAVHDLIEKERKDNKAAIEAKDAKLAKARKAKYEGKTA